MAKLNATAEELGKLVKAFSGQEMNGLELLLPDVEGKVKISNMTMDGSAEIKRQAMDYRLKADGGNGIELDIHLL